MYDICHSSNFEVILQVSYKCFSKGKLTLLSLFSLKILRKVTFVTDLRLLRGAYTFVTAKFSLKYRGDFASLSHSDIPQNIELIFIHLSQFYPKILKWLFSIYICSKTCVNFIITSAPFAQSSGGKILIWANFLF